MTINQYDQNVDIIGHGFAGIKRDPIHHIRGKALPVLLIILLKCNHSDHDKFCFDGKPLPLKRGNWVTSIQIISILSGLTIRNVRTALNNLKKMEVIETKNVANRATLISLNNPDYYLISNNYLTNNMTKKRQTTDNRLTINYNDDNDKNENNPQTPETEMKIFKEFKGGYGEFRALLDEESIQKAKDNCKGWDFLNLMNVYISWIKRNGLPENIKVAFSAWCLSYTKGKPPR